MGFWKRVFGQEGRKNTPEEATATTGAPAPREKNERLIPAAPTATSAAPTPLPSASGGAPPPVPPAVVAPSGAWRARPIFISSTFRDMHTERDYLAAEVLPELADRVRPMHIHLEPIDLRVGVETLDAATEDLRQRQVLKVCLDDIERSRPFMIVLLGDRYGWVPPRERMDAAVQEKGFQTETAGKSVTALEIEFGILKSPDQRRRSFFYFRDPLPYDQMPPETAAFFSDERGARSPDPAVAPAAAEAHRNLQALKARILTEYPDRVRHYSARWENGSVAGLEALKAHILADVTREIEAEAAEFARQPPPSDLEEFIERRARGFVGRAELLARLRAFALDPAPAAPGTDWAIGLTGESGAGKSAVFARLHRDLEQNANILLLSHAAGAGPQSASVDAMLRGWIARLAAALGVRNPIEELEAPAQAEQAASRLERASRKQATAEEVDKAFASLLGRAAASRRVVILLDALNQFEPTPRGRHLTWLPRPWPPNARLVATAIPGPESEALGAMAGVSLEDLPPLTEADARAIADAVYARYHRAPNRDVVRVLLEKKRPGKKRPGDGAPACANPLWLQLALEELNLLDTDDFARAEREFTGSPEQRLHQMVLDVARRLPADIEDLLGWLLSRAEELYGRDWTHAFANLLALGRNGWRETDFQDLIPRLIGVDPAAWDPIRFAALRRSFRGQVVRRGAKDQWDFAHALLRRAVQTRNLRDLEKAKSLHARIADYLESLPPTDPVRREELMFHIIGADDRRRAAQLYGSDLPDELLSGATRTLAEWILAGMEQEPNPALEWAASLPQQENLRADVLRNLCDHLNFDLSDAIENQATLSTRLAVLKAARSGFEQLVQQDPSNAGWQRDLTVSHIKIGDVLLDQGDLAGALEAYRKSMGVAERLAAADPSNAVWQRDLAVSFHKLAGMCDRTNLAAEAAQYWIGCRDVLRGMRRRGQFMDRPIANLLDQLERKYP